MYNVYLHRELLENSSRRYRNLFPFLFFSSYQPVSVRLVLYPENFCERLKINTYARVTVPLIIAAAATCPDAVSHLRVATSPRGRPFVLTSVVLSSRPPHLACESLQYTNFQSKNKSRTRLDLDRFV